MSDHSADRPPQETASRARAREGEVSGALTAALFDEIERRGGDLDALASGTGLDVAAFRDRTRSVPWDAFATVMENAARPLSEEELVTLGGLFVVGDSGAGLRLLGHEFRTPAAIYRWALQPTHQLISCIRQTVHEEKRGSLVVESWMAPGYESSRSYLMARRGFLKQLPTALGYPPAEVELEWLPRGVRYRVRMPEARGRLAGLRHWLTAPLRMRDAARELRESSDMLRAYQLETQQHLEELERTERALRESDERFARAFRVAPIGMLVNSESDGRILDVNDRFCELVGFAREDVLGRTATDLGLWDSLEVRDGMRALRGSAGQIRDAEITVRRRGGERLDLLVSAEVVHLGGERCVIWQGVDISERKRIERELDESRAHLEERVAERTLALEQSRRQLIEAERLASLGTLAAGIAHQINNPVAAMRAAAELALISSSEPDAQAIHRQALQTCVDESIRCGRIVRNVLQFSRGRSEDRRAIDVRELAQRAVGLVEAYALRRRGHIELAPGDGALPSRMSPIEMEQAVVNVLNNAIESREGASVRVEVTGDGDCAWIRVSDDGPGIDGEALKRVFDPFFTTRLDQGGTGLGLSVVHGVVADHDGRVDVESPPGGGTVVTIELPLEPLAAAAEPS